MHRLIRTNAPRGSLIEHDGVLWRVGAPSPHWPDEAECTTLACPNCNHQPCHRNDQDHAICGRCDWHDQLVAPDPFRTAIDELVAEGLWTEHHE